MKMHERLKFARESAGYRSARSAAESREWTVSTYSGHENGSRNPSFEDIEKYARAFRVDPSWIAFNKGQMAAEESVDQVTHIPRYDIQLSAGSGALNFEGSKIDIPIPFAPDFLPKKLGRESADGLTIVEAAGDSMTPTIDDGDLIMLDMNDTRHRAGIFGFELAGETYVKRLEWTEFGIHLISDNQLYPMRALSPEKAEAESFKLIGRVVWVGRVFRN